MSNEPGKKYDFSNELDDLIADEWTPHAKANDGESKKVDLEQVREIAEGQGFSSREPKPTVQKEPEGQVLIRAKVSVIEDFKAFGKAQKPRWPHSYILERALAALKKEMEG